MLKLSLSVLLLVALPGRAAQIPVSVPVECGAELQNLELEVGSPPTRVCVAPGVSTYLSLDTPVLMDRTVLEGNEISVTPSPTGLTLVATPDLAAGERRKLTVYFGDGKEPSSATFVLVGQGSGKPRQVNVFRRARTAASLRQEAEAQRQRAEVCELQLARCSAQEAPPALLEKLLKRGSASGLTLEWRQVDPPAGQRGDVTVRDITTTRVEVEEGQHEAAVRLRLRNIGTAEWTFEGASLAPLEEQALVGVRVLPDGSFPARFTKQIDVVVGPTQQELTGTYTLKLWGGGRELTVENITFP